MAEIEVVPNRSFRRAYVLTPGYSFESLKPHCKQIIFASDGVTRDLAELADQLNFAFQYFDPDTDCIIPSGTAPVNLLAGSILAKRFANAFLFVGIYQKGERGAYTFYSVPADLVNTEVKYG